MGVSATFRQLDRRKQARILSVATNEFASSGYAGASINVIVEKVGISKGSIFNYFTDKRGLFMFVFEQALEQVKDHLRRVRDETRSEELSTRLEKSLLAGVAFIRSHPRIYRLYLRILFDSDLPGRRVFIESIRRHSMEYLRDLLLAARERGEIDEGIDTDVAAFVVESVLERFLQAYSVEHLDGGIGLFKADDKDAERWAKRVVGLLIGGLVATGNQ